MDRIDAELQRIVDGVNKQCADARVTGGQWTLGKLIDALKHRKPDQDVMFDFCGCVPESLHSYRGYYEQLAIGWLTEGSKVVSALLADLEAAIGKTFEGYKGGDFVMSRETPLWVANYGDSGGTAVVGIADCTWVTVIRTAFIE